MSNKNMTAVEWLFDKITQNQDIRWRGTQYEDLFEQAKAMEKEQIELTAIKCHFEGVRQKAKTSEQYIEYGEQYYKETYEL
jgi:hypothetical protein